jgi:carbonic anhydrase
VAANQGNTYNVTINYGFNFITVNYKTDGIVRYFGTGSPPSFDDKYCAIGEFEIHSPSEHTYRGEHYDVEIEIIHRN